MRRGIIRYVIFSIYWALVILSITFLVILVLYFTAEIDLLTLLKTLIHSPF
jgi:hypothetical protein